MKTYKIYLLRHGLTQGNLEGRYIGHTDEHLCAQGEQRLKELAEKCEYPPVSVLFSSPLKRCVETAKIIYPEMQPIILNDFIECNFGEFENKTAEELSDDADFAAWVRGEADSAPPFGESSRDFGIRVCNAFAKSVDALITEGITSAAYVLHGGVIMTILSAFGSPEMPVSYWRMDDGCGYALLINASIWSRLKKAEITDELPYYD